MASWYELSKSKDDQFKFVLKAANSEIILTSELYEAKASAENGIASVRANCGTDTATNSRPPQTGNCFSTSRPQTSKSSAQVKCTSRKGRVRSESLR